MTPASGNPVAGRRRRRLIPLAGLGIAVVLLGIPACPPNVTPPANSTPFRWDADRLFATLEEQYLLAGTAGLEASTAVLDSLEGEGTTLLATIATSHEPSFGSLDRLATLQFELAVRGAAHASLLPRVEAFFIRARRTVMRSAVTWSLDRPSHEAIYRVLYGGRIALDEASIQAGVEVLPSIEPIEPVPSSTPSIVVEGVRVHSGDILLSRGGAPTSALIARGNDFPNVFSHAALVHVDAETGEGTVVESLIETGAVLTSVEDYLEDKKHRILVLRLRPDHPALSDDPLLPHRAAAAMLAHVRAGHVPYDFAMEWDDASSMFCSEVVFHAYREVGVALWPLPLRASMSSPGLVRWLAGMGVRQFTSLVPSDVEMDPQLHAVVEWRDSRGLTDFRLDNAILDVLLEEAERGGQLGYAWYLLPPARLLKGYSALQSMVGRTPKIPQGMSASTGLRVNALVSKVHPTIRTELVRLTERYRETHGYEAPYWDLVGLAREALDATRASLSPWLVRR